MKPKQNKRTLHVSVEVREGKRIVARQKFVKSEFGMKGRAYKVVGDRTALITLLQPFSYNRLALDQL